MSLLAARQSSSLSGKSGVGMGNRRAINLVGILGLVFLATVTSVFPDNGGFSIELNGI